MRFAVFLDGPIGAGKTSYGRALAAELGAAFVDGDDHAAPDRPWFASILSTSRAILAAGLRGLDGSRRAVVIAYPLGCTTWIFHRRHFAAAGVQPIFVSLSASYEAIVAPERGRQFSPAEHERIRGMIAEGYGARRFCDLRIDTGVAPFAATLARLSAGVRSMMEAAGADTSREVRANH